MEEKKGSNLYSPTHAERLVRFAASHFVISVLAAFLAIAVGFLLFALTAWIGEVGMYVILITCSAAGLFVYAVAGYHSAKTYGWHRPQNPWNGFLAFLFPALIAWIWGSLMLYCTSLSGVENYRLVSGLLAVNFFGALPSLVMVVTSLVLGFLDGGLLNMIICMLFVGGLPPLLFLLGSIWGGRKNEQRTMQSTEGKEEADETQQRDTTA